MSVPPEPQFRARLTFTFREHGPERRRFFAFGESGHRRVPLQMEGVPDLHTVGMWQAGAATYHEGEEAEVDCVLLQPEGFRDRIRRGATFELWDGGFFASGIVLERCDSGWPHPSE